MRIISFFFFLLVLASCKSYSEKVEESAPPSVVVIHDTVTVDTTGAIIENTATKSSDSIIVTPVIVLPKNILLDTIAKSQVGVREDGYIYIRKKRTKKDNVGADVEKYLRSVKLGPGNPWCAAFVKWCLDSADIKTTINGLASSTVNKKNIIYNSSLRRKDRQENEIQVGDIFYWKMGSGGHTGIITAIDKNNKTVWTIEGNTSGGRKKEELQKNNKYKSENIVSSNKKETEKEIRDGNGVYIRQRSLSSFQSISRWVN